MRPSRRELADASSRLLQDGSVKMLVLLGKVLWSTAKQLEKGASAQQLQKDAGTSADSVLLTAEGLFASVRDILTDAMDAAIARENAATALYPSPQDDGGGDGDVGRKEQDQTGAGVVDSDEAKEEKQSKEDQAKEKTDLYTCSSPPSSLLALSTLIHVAHKTQVLVLAVFAQTEHSSQQQHGRSTRGDVTELAPSSCTSSSPSTSASSTSLTNMSALTQAAVFGLGRGLFVHAFDAFVAASSSGPSPVSTPPLSSPCLLDICAVLVECVSPSLVMFARPVLEKGEDIQTTANVAASTSSSSSSSSSSSFSSPALHASVASSSSSFSSPVVFAEVQVLPLLQQHIAAVATAASSMPSSRTFAAFVAGGKGAGLAAIDGLCQLFAACMAGHGVTAMGASTSPSASTASPASVTLQSLVLTLLVDVMDARALTTESIRKLEKRKAKDLAKLEKGAREKEKRSAAYLAQQRAWETDKYQKVSIGCRRPGWL